MCSVKGDALKRLTVRVRVARERLSDLGLAGRVGSSLANDVSLLSFPRRAVCFNDVRWHARAQTSLSPALIDQLTLKLAAHRKLAGARARV